MATTRRNRKDDVPVITSEQTDANANGELHDEPLAPEPEDDDRVISAGAIEAAPPPGVAVTHQHTTRWNAQAPNTAQAARGFTPQQFSDAPVDPLREFLDQFNDGGFYTMQVTRDPDPLLKRPPNPTYLRPCFVREILGNGLPFSPHSFIEDLRMLNGGSGGNFSVGVYDEAEQFVDAWHGNIGDPVVMNNAAAPAAAAAPQADQMSTFMNFMRQQAEFVKLSRIVAGVPEGGAQQTNAAAPVDPELQFAAMLINKADIVGNMTRTVVDSVSKVVSSGGVEKPTSFMDAIKTAITTNPKLQTRLMQTVDRVVDVGARAVGVETAPPIPPNGAGEPELNNTNDEDEPDAIDANTDEDAAEAVMMDFLMNECAEDRKVTFQHPVFAAFGEQKPESYNMLLMGLKMMGPEQLIDTILTRAAEFDRAGAYRLVLKRPEGVAWVAHLQTSAINSQPLETETQHGDETN